MKVKENIWSKRFCVEHSIVADESLQKIVIDSNKIQIDIRLSHC